MDLDFAFSESSQPMTLTSRFIGLDRYGNETALFDIFCAIATTPTEAYPQSTQTNGVAKPSNRQRSMSTSVKPENGARRTDSIRTSSSRPASTRPGSARPRASLNLTGRASQFRDLPNPAGEEGDLSQQGQAEEPLFQPGPTQSSQGVRMTQQEVLELAGMGDLDMEALLGDEDADMGDEAQAANEDAPAGWEDVTADFENIPDEHMSTQRDAVAAARQKRQKPNGSGADEAVSAGTASASKLSRVEQLSRQPSINAATVKRSESSMEFKPISNMLDPGATEQRDEREDSNGTEVDEEGEVEELDEDAVDATQPSGHKVNSFMFNADTSSNNSSRTECFIISYLYLCICTTI